MRLKARFRALTVPEPRSCAMLPLRAASALRCASTRARASAMKRPCPAWTAAAASMPSPWADSAAGREAEDAGRPVAGVAAEVAGSIRLRTLRCSMLRSVETRSSSDARLAFGSSVAEGVEAVVRLGACRVLP